MRTGSAGSGTSTMDPQAREVTLGGRTVELTRTEFDILDVLSSAPRRAFSAGAAWSRRVGGGLVRRRPPGRRSHRPHPRQARRRQRGTPLHPHRARASATGWDPDEHPAEAPGQAPGRGWRVRVFWAMGLVVLAGGGP